MCISKWIKWILKEAKGQLISKANCQAEDSSKKRTNEFVFTSMRRVFVGFSEESSARKKTFRDYLTFTVKKNLCIFLESPYQVDMKNIVKCRKYFFAYSNALET